MAQKRREMKFTEEEGRVIDALIAATGDRFFATLVRRLIRDEATQYNMVFPMNMQTREETIQRARAKRWSKKTSAS